MARDDLHFRLRIPDELKSRVEAAAKSARRSMTAEIIARVEQSFSTWPKVVVSPEIVERAMAASPEKREEAEWQLNAAAESYLAKVFPGPRADIENFYEMFESVLNDAPEEERPRLREEFAALISGIYDSAPVEVEDE